jgi:hypothetical protein
MGRGRVTVDALSKHLLDLDEALFSSQFPHPALVFSAFDPDQKRSPQVDPMAETGEHLELPQKPRFVTQADENGPTPDRPIAIGRATDAPGRLEVVFLEKTDRNPFAHMITVGRAPNNDVILAHPTISKVHAYLSGTPSGWTLTDQKSRNGTYLQGNQLPAGSTTPLTDGDVVRLGPEIRATFFSPHGLYQFLLRHRKGKT